MKYVHLLSVLLFVGMSSLVHAKELSNRLGVGIKNNVSEDVPSIGAVYFPNADYAFTGGLGIDTRKNESKFAATVGLRKIVFSEPQMNFFMGGQVGVVNFESAGNKNSGFELSALFGAEFFFVGLDSLAFTFEGGAGVVSVSDVRFRTIADNPFKAGIIFYF